MAAQESAAQRAQAGRSSGDRRGQALDGYQLTRASGRPGGVPTDRPTRHDPDDDESARRSVELENATAAILAADGYQVHQNPIPVDVARARRDAGDLGRPGSRPDYLIEGRVFDCYCPQTQTSARNVWTETKKKITKLQTQRVVVNLADWGGDVSALRRQFADWPIENAKEVKFVLPDGSIVQMIPNPNATESSPHGA